MKKISKTGVDTHAPLAKVTLTAETSGTERIQAAIHVIRGQRVMVDADLAELYGVPTKALNQAVKRNAQRFPHDFCFRLEPAELAELVTNCDQFGRRKHSYTMPLVFTEHGALMAASMLNTPKAIEVSLFVVRAFVRVRELAVVQVRIDRELDKLRDRVDVHDASITAIMDVLGQLLTNPPKPTKRIGFKTDGSGPKR